MLGKLINVWGRSLFFFRPFKIIFDKLIVVQTYDTTNKTQSYKAN
jgi:hypothetical protein